MFRRKKEREPRLRACVQGIGNCTIICGLRSPQTVEADIITGRNDIWIAVQQPGGRLNVRRSAITALWIED